jgi:GT2 family glycosyltransferase
VSGRWTPPTRVGFGVCALRTSTIERLGGWDERLGAGTRDFPAAEDMDFNYRLLRAGGVAYWNPAIRVVHEQWRDDAAVVRVYSGRAAAWAGFAVKHFKTGDRAGGAWLWWRGFVDCARMLASAGRRRHSIRVLLGLSMFRAFAMGTARALRRSW